MKPVSYTYHIYRCHTTLTYWCTESFTDKSKKNYSMYHCSHACCKNSIPTLCIAVLCRIFSYRTKRLSCTPMDNIPVAGRNLHFMRRAQCVGKRWITDAWFGCVRHRRHTQWHPQRWAPGEISSSVSTRSIGKKCYFLLSTCGCGCLVSRVIHRLLVPSWGGGEHLVNRAQPALCSCVFMVVRLSLGCCCRSYVTF